MFSKMSRVNYAHNSNLRSYSNKVDGTNSGVTVESYGRKIKAISNSISFQSIPLTSMTIDVDSVTSSEEKIADSIYEKILSNTFTEHIEYRDVEWPPVMRVPSDDLKRCLGDVKMDNRTMRKRLLNLGYNSTIDFVVTVELVETIRERNSQNSELNLDTYKPQSKYGQELL